MWKRWLPSERYITKSGGNLNRLKINIIFLIFFLRGRLIDINKLYRIVEKKDKRKCNEINSENKRKDGSREILLSVIKLIKSSAYLQL